MLAGLLPNLLHMLPVSMQPLLLMHGRATQEHPLLCQILGPLHSLANLRMVMGVTVT